MAESHYLRTSIVSTLLEHLGMTKKDDVSQHIKLNRIKKANASVRQVLYVLREMVNPFEMAGESPLFNIATRKSVMSETDNFLLNIDIIGDRERNKFLESSGKGQRDLKKELRDRNFELSQQKLEKKKKKNYIER